MTNTTAKTAKTRSVYGFLWTETVNSTPLARWHYHDMQDAVPDPIVRGSYGIDVGSGCGYDTYFMAKANPSCHVVGLDMCDGVYTAKKAIADIRNASIVGGSALNIPMKDNTFDFAYSYGVLHHTPDPVRGIREMVRVVKRGSPVYLYLYEKHEESPVKRATLGAVTLLRRVTTRMPPRALYLLSCMLSPFVFMVFTVPAGIFRRFRATYPLYEKMPFNFARSFFSLRGDLYDRFSAPIEHRFGRDELRGILENASLKKVNVTRLKAIAGLVAWGYKT